MLILFFYSSGNPRLQTWVIHIIGFAISLIGIAIEIASAAYIYTHTLKEETKKRNIATVVFDIRFRLIIIGLLIILTNAMFITAVSRG